METSRVKIFNISAIWIDFVNAGENNLLVFWEEIPVLFWKFKTDDIKLNHFDFYHYWNDIKFLIKPLTNVEWKRIKFLRKRFANSAFLQQLVLISKVPGIDKQVYIKVKYALYKSKKYQQRNRKFSLKKRKKHNIDY